MSNASLELGGGKWGTKDGNLLGYASSTSSNKFVSREFTFTRGSDIAATRVNSSGVIEKYRENLLLQSNQFDTSPWVSSSVTLTSGQLGYDGSTDAWLLTKTGTGFRNVYQYINELGVATLTVHAKAGSTNWMRLTHGGKTAYFDLSGSGAIGVTSNGIDQTITGVGNGWFKCTLTANRTVAGQVPIYPYTAEGDSSGSTDSIYIQDVQLEKGLVATSYLESGATTATSGVADNEPRIDYAGGTASLLLEPSRTNTTSNSEYFAGGYLVNITLTSNTTTSPDGNQNASTIVSSTSASQPKLLRFIGTAAGASEDQTFSLFVKKYNHRYIQLINEGDANSYANFDIEDGIVGNYGSGTTASIEDYGNGWYRCTIVLDSSHTIAANNRVYLVHSLTQGYANASNVASGDGVYIWGAMQENNASYPTSYIPNHSGGSVTRNADYFKVINQEGLFGTNEGTFFMEFAFDVNNKYIGIGDTWPSDKVTIGLNASGTNQIRSLIINDGVGINLQGSGTTLGETIKACVSYGSNGFKLFMNGSLEDSDSTAARLAQFSDLIPNVDVRDVGGANSGTIKQILVFPTALSNTDCEILTGTSYESFAAMATALNYTTYE